MHKASSSRSTTFCDAMLSMVRGETRELVNL